MLEGEADADDGGQGGAQLVRDRVQEGVLHPVQGQQPLGDLPLPLQGPLGLGDVDAHPLPEQRPAGLVADQHALVPEPPHVAVLGDVAVLHPERLSRLLAAGLFGQDPLQVVGVDDRLPEVPLPRLLGRVAEQRLDLAVDVLAGTPDLELLAVDDRRDLLDEGPEPALGLLALDQLLLGGGVQAGVVEGDRDDLGEPAHLLDLVVGELSAGLGEGQADHAGDGPGDQQRDPEHGPEGVGGHLGDVPLPAAVVGDGQGGAGLPDPPREALALEHAQPDEVGVGAGPQPQHHLPGGRLDQADVAVGGADHLAGPGDDPLQQPTGGQVVAVDPGLGPVHLRAHGRVLARAPGPRRTAPPPPGRRGRTPRW